MRGLYFFMPAPIAINSVDTFVSEQHQDVSVQKNDFTCQMTHFYPKERYMP